MKCPLCEIELNWCKDGLKHPDSTCVLKRMVAREHSWVLIKDVVDAARKPKKPICNLPLNAENSCV